MLHINSKHAYLHILQQAKLNHQLSTAYINNVLIVTVPDAGHLIHWAMRHRFQFAFSWLNPLHKEYLFDDEGTLTPTSLTLV